MSQAIKHAVVTRGIGNAFRRMNSIIGRYGLTEGKMKSKLHRYCTILKRNNCTATFSITAVTLKRHCRLIRSIQGKGIEFAIHGNVHRDISALNRQGQEKHLNEAMNRFNACNINFYGFRGPYLRYNRDTENILSRHGLYNSTSTILWNVVPKIDIERNNESYEKLVNLYKPLNSGKCLSVPTIKPTIKDNNSGGLVSIPVSLPDDELLIDRLNIIDSDNIYRIWQGILNKTYERGELFVLQLHPERIELCAGALEQILRESASKNPPVATFKLKEIADWWRDRHRFEIRIEGSHINIDASRNATIILRNVKTDVTLREWFGAWERSDAHRLAFNNRTFPAIGVSPGVSEDFIKFLRGEGFFIDETANREKYGMYFEEDMDAVNALKAIESSTAPLARIWRWPHGARSAFCISGDIDSITIWDYILRIFGR